MYRKRGAIICVIAAKFANNVDGQKPHITKRTLRAMFTANSDGAGYMYAKDGVVHINKGLFTFRTFYKAFRMDERANPDANFVIHMRIATSGLVDETNCHPFKVNDKIAFCHNGIFSKMGTRYISDTREFMYSVLQKLPPNFIDRPDVLNALEQYAIAGSNKLVFLDNEGYIFIANQNGGHWKDGIWYSNLHHEWLTNKHYDYGSYSDYDFYDWKNSYNSACDRALRKCGVCEKLLPLSQLDWDKAYQYWICADCAITDAMTYDKIAKNSDAANDDLSYRRPCVACGYSESHIHVRNADYCNQCWESLLEYATLECPHCMMTTTVDKWYACQTCGCILEEDEVIMQMENSVLLDDTYC